MEHDNPVSYRATGKRAVRRADCGAGVGDWKKRMPRCNGADTGSNFARRESEQTSSWCLIAREAGEPILWGKANDGVRGAPGNGQAAFQCRCAPSGNGEPDR
ncbi:hypothetical protein FDY93_19055 [Microbulbifer harenosus]|uniref:Uncharacterized protein n=1 Tax=Microbulbifer harenosus TaxID=2576840 RepID=A0ABY2UEV1_9GAMM|nr:hypothetical protein FDY93_19055 [Microbulbifer harenosus]